jgi:hypothetical protein
MQQSMLAAVVETKRDDHEADAAMACGQRDVDLRLHLRRRAVCLGKADGRNG